MQAQPGLSVLLLVVRGWRGPGRAAGLGVPGVGALRAGCCLEVPGGCEFALGHAFAGVLLGMHGCIPTGARSCAERGQVAQNLSSSSSS